MARHTYFEQQPPIAREYAAILDHRDRILGSIPQPLLDEIAQRLGMDIHGMRIDLLGSPRSGPSDAPDRP